MQYKILNSYQNVDAFVISFCMLCTDSHQLKNNNFVYKIKDGFKEVSKSRPVNMRPYPDF